MRNADGADACFALSTACPNATFVSAGTVHAGPAPADGARAYIFEIK